MRDRRGRAERAWRSPGTEGTDHAPGGLEIVEHGDSRWVLDAPGGRYARLPRDAAETSLLSLPWSRCSRIERLADGSVVIELDPAGHSRIRLDGAPAPVAATPSAPFDAA